MGMEADPATKPAIDHLTPGKYRRLSRLCDEQGRFAMLAIDQRGSLQRMIGVQRGIPEETVADEDLDQVKRIVTGAIAPRASAVLTDPVIGYPGSLNVIPPHIGTLLSLEVTGYEAVNDKERISHLIEGWSVARIQQVGGDAVKLLLWHHPEVAPATRRHQEDIVRQVGDACTEADMPFVLEIVTYSLDKQTAKGPGFARIKPDLVIDAARVYSDPVFGVDVLKLEFPAELKYTEEYQSRNFGKGEVVYDLATVRDINRKLDQASGVPWVILSAGVDPEEFVEDVRVANAAGASGFLCGRAVWKHAVDRVGNEEQMRSYMESTGRQFFDRIVEANRDAVPWYRHRRYQGVPAEKEAF